MAVDYDEIRRRRPAAVLAKADALGARMLRDLQLRELRARLGLSQAEVAGKLKLNQAAVSKIESRPNLTLRTASRYVRALGGRLRVTVEIGGKTYRLTGFESKRAPHRAAGNGRRQERPLR